MAKIDLPDASELSFNPGNVAVDIVRRTAPRIITGAVVDPVILAMEKHFGRFKLEMKMTKKRKNL